MDVSLFYSEIESKIVLLGIFLVYRDVRGHYTTAIFDLNFRKFVKSYFITDKRQALYLFYLKRPLILPAKISV